MQAEEPPVTDRSLSELVGRLDAEAPFSVQAEGDDGVELFTRLTGRLEHRAGIYSSLAVCIITLGVLSILVLTIPLETSWGTLLVMYGTAGASALVFCVCLLVLGYGMLRWRATAESYVIQRREQRWEHQGFRGRKMREGRWGPMACVFMASDDAGYVAGLFLDNPVLTPLKVYEGAELQACEAVCDLLRRQLRLPLKR